MNSYCCRCASPASSAMSYDYGRREMWIEDVTLPQPFGWYSLCERHADRLTPPLSWTLDDRRLAAPMLPFQREVA